MFVPSTVLQYTYPSCQYLSKYEQMKNGELKVLSSEPVDWSDWYGVVALCGGSASPWGTSLHGEETDPDARCALPCLLVTTRMCTHTHARMQTNIAQQCTTQR